MMIKIIKSNKTTIHEGLYDRDSQNSHKTLAHVHDLHADGLESNLRDPAINHDGRAVKASGMLAGMHRQKADLHRGATKGEGNEAKIKNLEARINAFSVLQRDHVKSAVEKFKRITKSFGHGKTGGSVIKKWNHKTQKAESRRTRNRYSLQEAGVPSPQERPINVQQAGKEGEVFRQPQAARQQDHLARAEDHERRAREVGRNDEDTPEIVKAKTLLKSAHTVAGHLHRLAHEGRGSPEYSKHLGRADAASDLAINVGKQFNTGKRDAIDPQPTHKILGGVARVDPLEKRARWRGKQLKPVD